MIVLLLQTPAPDPAFILNGTTLLAIGSVLGSMAAALGYMYRSSRSDLTDRIMATEERLRRSEEALLKANETNAELSKGLAEATRELRELRMDLWRRRQINDPDRNREGIP